MKKSFFWTIVAIVALLAVTAWGRGQQVERRALENHLLAQYQRSFYDLTTQVENLEVLLGKSLVANGEQSVAILSKIMLEADAAQENLTNLPVSEVTVARTAKFLTQVGDYASTLAKQVAGGDKISVQDRETLEKLYHQAINLSRDMHNVEAEVSDGSIHMVEMIKEGRRVLPRESSQTMTESFSTVDQEMQRYPTLVYDGPFSDHLEKRGPASDLGERITPGEAVKKALSFAGKSPGEGYTAKVLGSIEANIPSFKVEIRRKTKNGNKPNARNIPVITAAVSKMGGRVVWMLSPSGGIADTKVVNSSVAAGSSNAGSIACNSDLGGTISVAGTRLDRDVNDLAKKAERFLARRGYSSVELTGYRRGEGLVVFNFAPVEKGIILYPDNLKVTTATGDGSITAFDASGYLLSHRDREFPTPKLTQAEAKSKICPDLKVKGGRLVVLPLPNGEERFVYEFRGVADDNQTFFVYVNAMDGREENILRIISNQEGVFNM